MYRAITRRGRSELDRRRACFRSVDSILKDNPILERRFHSPSSTACGASIPFAKIIGRTPAHGETEPASPIRFHARSLRYRLATAAPSVDADPIVTFLNHRIQSNE
jgi:hypothetical protein